MRSFRQKPVGWRNESYRHYLAAKGIKTGRKGVVNFFVPDKGENLYEGVAPLEVLTGLRKPRGLRIPEFPHEARLTESESRARVGEDQREIARLSDEVANELMKPEDKRDVGLIERNISVIRRLRDEQDLARGGKEVRFFGGRPLTKRQLREREELRERHLRELGIE